jgi:integrase
MAPMARRGRRGYGTVYWSKLDRRWIARWPLGVVDGKRQDRRAKFRTEAEADAKLEEFRKLYGAGGRPSDLTLGAYLARWLPEHGRSIRPSTRVSYAGHVRLHINPLLGGIPLAELAPRDVRRLVGELERKGKAPATIHLVIRTLSTALNAAVADRTITDNATEGVRLPRVEREPVHPMTATDADAILDAVAGTWLDLPVRVLLGSGLRLGEVIGLDQRDVLPGFVRIRRSKTVVRAVPVSQGAGDALLEAIRHAPRIGPDEPVFFGPRRNRRGDLERLSGQSLTHALPRVLEAKKLAKLTPHALRHGAATLMLADGTPMRVISEQLGHRNPSLTARVYAHVIPEAQRSAVASLERRRARRGSG